MKIACNQTHRFTRQLKDVPQDDIAACPTLNGLSPYDVLSDKRVPETIRDAVKSLPWGWGGERTYRWLYVRPQLVDLTQADRRSGSFWHIDVDAVFRCVAPDWNDFRAMAVSFGDIAETEFMATPFDIDVDGPPRSSHYVELLAQLEGKTWTTEQAKPCQVALYTIRDFHRAGPCRRSGWRLIILAFETNAPPKETWP